MDGPSRLPASPDDHGIEWLKHADKYGRRSMPPTSLAHLRRRTSEKKWPEAWSWCERRRLNKGYCETGFSVWKSESNSSR